MRGDGSAESPTWTPMPGIAIGDEPIVSIDFARSAPGKAYAVSGSGRLFRKDDVNDDVTAPAWNTVAQWASPTNSQVRQLAVNGQDANRVYLITAKEIVTWTPTAGWSSINGSGPQPCQVRTCTRSSPTREPLRPSTSGSTWAYSYRGTTAPTGTPSTRICPTPSSSRSSGTRTTFTPPPTAAASGVGAPALDRVLRGDCSKIDRFPTGTWLSLPQKECSTRPRTAHAPATIWRLLLEGARTEGGRSPLRPPGRLAHAPDASTGRFPVLAASPPAFPRSLLAGPRRCCHRACPPLHQPADEDWSGVADATSGPCGKLCALIARADCSHRLNSAARRAE
jgi:hypothetical protein